MTVIVSTSAAAAGAGLVSGASIVGTSSGVGITALGKAMSTGAGAFSSAAGAMGGSVSAGAIFGTAWTGTASGGLIGGATAAASSAALALIPNIIASPVGWLVLGTEHNQALEICTFDCWKPVLHDESSEPSNGKLLKDVIVDVRIKGIAVRDSTCPPELILENIWDEKFAIQFVNLPSNNISLHAARLN